MARVATALVAVFAAIVLGLLALFWLARYRLEHARITEHVMVIASAPGYSVSTAENVIALPLEQALGALKGLESMRTEVREGHVAILVEVTVIGVDATPPAMLVNEAVKNGVKYLPAEVSPPIVSRFDAKPRMLRYVASSDRLPRAEITQWLDTVFRRAVELQPGVRELQRCGGATPELDIRLDQQRLSAYGLSAHDVVSAIRNDELRSPVGTLNADGFALRLDRARLDDLELLQLNGAGVRLRDVAILDRNPRSDSCTSAKDLLLTVRVAPEAEVTLPPPHPHVTVTPFTPKRVLTYLRPPGVTSEAAMRALMRAHPGALITATGDELTVFLSDAPQRLDEVPGLALRRVDDAHSIVRVSGPDFAQLVDLGARVRGLLVKEPARWVGSPWPGLGPEQVVKPSREVKDLAELLQLATSGVVVGRLDDGSTVRVRTGTEETKLEDLLLPDGRRASEVLEISVEEVPQALLRVNGQRTVELEVGLGQADVQRVLSTLQLPAGYSAEVQTSP